MKLYFSLNVDLFRGFSVFIDSWLNFSKEWLSKIVGFISLRTMISLKDLSIEC